MLSVGLHGSIPHHNYIPHNSIWNSYADIIIQAHMTRHPSSDDNTQNHATMSLYILVLPPTSVKSNAALNRGLVAMLAKVQCYK